MYPSTIGVTSVANLLASPDMADTVTLIVPEIFPHDKVQEVLASEVLQGGGGQLSQFQQRGVLWKRNLRKIE